MKRFPSHFAIMALVMLMIFIFIVKLMNNAEKDLKKLEQKRAKQGGANEYEKQLNSLLK
jgi:hypothetical protein